MTSPHGLIEVRERHVNQLFNTIAPSSFDERELPRSRPLALLLLPDLLVREVPVVLRTDLYALAALSGAAIMIGGHEQGWPVVPTAIGGVLACFVMRIIAIRRGWRLPVADHPPER